MGIFNTIIKKCKFLFDDLARCGSIAETAYQKSSAEKKTTGPLISVSMCVNNTDWEETKKEKAHPLKSAFIPAQSIEEVIQKAQKATNEFLINHGQSPDNVIATFQKIELPGDLKKKEVVLRKELNTVYKNRENTESSALALYLAFEHTKLLLTNPEVEWKNFSGLQKLQSNWKAEEYFDALLTIMYAFQETFPNSPSVEKLSKDIERIFELWDSRNIAKNTYDENLLAFPKAKSTSDKHFIILGIIGYLDRRYKFNHKYRNELVHWCEKDVALYEQFLIEFHEYLLFSIDEQMEFIDNPSLKHKKLSLISLDKVKRLKNYSVPWLPSYNILEQIYEQEGNAEKLAWLRGIGQRIGYIEHGVTEQEEVSPIKDLDFSDFTRIIEAAKSDEKGKLGFLNSLGKSCSTEDAFKCHAESSGWKVMRAEVAFWQAMFCLSFWEEIFDIGQPVQGQDIPPDLFRGEAFYLSRQQKIDLKFANIPQKNLQEFINNQIKKANGSWTRLLNQVYSSSIDYFRTPIVQEFLDKINPDVFAKIVYRIAQNPNKNRAGISDFVLWNEQELKMVEVKKIREQIRESQKNWFRWMAQENIPIEIIRMKAI